MADALPKTNTLSGKIRAKRYEPNGSSKQPENGKPRETRYQPSGSSKQSENGKPREKRYSADQARSSPAPSLSLKYIANFKFRIEIAGYEFGCARISNLSMSQEIEEIQEGGNNFAPRVMLAPNKKMGVLKIERALLSNDSLVMQWVPGTMVSAGTITIQKQEPDTSLGKDNAIARFSFSGGVITKSDIADLDAMGSQILMHTLEITHYGLYPESVV